MHQHLATHTFLAALSLSLLACNGTDETGDSDNSAPTAQDDTFDVNEDEAGTSVPLDVRANDSDPDDDELAVAEVTQPANGTAEIAGPDLYIFYTSNADFSGEDTFEYTISDGRGGTDTASVTVTVAAPAPLPCQEEGDCTLVITAPEDGASDVVGPTVSVSFEVTGCSVDSPSNDPSGCHLHKVIDGEFYKDEGGSGTGHYNSDSFNITPIDNGDHDFQLILIKNDGSDDPFEVLVEDTVSFTVVPPELED